MFLLNSLQFKSIFSAVDLLKALIRNHLTNEVGHHVQPNDFFSTFFPRAVNSVGSLRSARGCQARVLNGVHGQQGVG